MTILLHYCETGSTINENFKLRSSSQPFPLYSSVSLPLRSVRRPPDILPDHLLSWNLEGPFREHFATACDTNSFNPERGHWDDLNLLRSQYEPFHLLQSLFKCSFRMNLYLSFQLLKNLPC